MIFWINALMVLISIILSRKKRSKMILISNNFKNEKVQKSKSKTQAKLIPQKSQQLSSSKKESTIGVSVQTDFETMKFWNVLNLLIFPRNCWTSWRFYTVLHRRAFLFRSSSNLSSILVLCVLSYLQYSNIPYLLGNSGCSKAHPVHPAPPPLIHTSYRAGVVEPLCTHFLSLNI